MLYKDLFVVKRGTFWQTQPSQRWLRRRLVGLEGQVPKQNKEERYSRVPRLSDIRYSAIGTEGKWR